MCPHVHFPYNYVYKYLSKWYLLLLLPHPFPLLCGIDVSYETPPFSPVFSFFPWQFSLRQVVLDVIQPPPLWSSSLSFPRHLHHHHSLAYVFFFSIHAHTTSTYSKLYLQKVLINVDMTSYFAYLSAEQVLTWKIYYTWSDQCTHKVMQNSSVPAHQGCISGYP